MGDQVWLMTSKHTEPLLSAEPISTPTSSVSGGHLQLVDVGMKDLVHETDTGRFVWIFSLQFNVYLPYSACKRSCET